MCSSEYIAEKMGMEVDYTDLGGYTRVKDHFDYIAINGYRSFSKNITLALMDVISVKYVAIKYKGVKFTREDIIALDEEFYKENNQ